MEKLPQPHLLVERALALVPDGEEFLPLSDAVIGASQMDREKLWAGSSAYATVGKRIVDPDRLSQLLPVILQRNQQRLQELFNLVLDAMREQRRGNDEGAAALLIRAGEMEEDQRSLEKAERVYRMALGISQNLRGKGPHILALRRLGRVARTSGRLEEAWSWYEQSYHLSLDEMDMPGQVIACQGLGNVRDDLGERERARTLWERGLKLARGLEQPRLEWPLYINLSIVSLMEGDIERAERLLAHARERIEEAETPSAMRYWFNNKGLILLKDGDAEGAERVFREGLARGDDPFWEMTTRINLGQSLVRQERLFEAEEEARTAEELAILHRFIPDLVDVYGLLGSIARARCDEEGFVFYEQALRVCRERDLPPKVEAEIYHGYGLLYLACERESEALAYLEQARDIYARIGFRPELGRVEQDLERLRSA